MLSRAATTLLTVRLRVFADRVANFDNPSDVIESLHQATSSVGIFVLGAWRVPARYDNWSAWRMNHNLFFQRDVAPAFFDDWMALAKKYGQSALAAKAARDGTPFTWSECMRESKLSGKGRWVFELYAKYGMRDGFCCPIGPWILHFWSPKLLQLPQPTRFLLYAAAVAAVQQLTKLTARQRLDDLSSEKSLTPRETEVLRLYSLGSRVREISQHLGIREWTVRAHLRHIQKKLDARHLGHAIARAKDSRFLVWPLAIANIDFNKAHADRRKVTSAPDMVAFSTIVALALSAAISEADGGNSSLTISGDDMAVDISRAASDYSSIVNSSGAAYPISHRMAGDVMDNEMVEVIHGKQDATISQTDIFNFDAAALQFDGSDATNALIITDGTDAGAISMPEDYTTKIAYSPSESATGDDTSLTSLQAISADNDFSTSSPFAAILSGNGDAFQFKPNLDHHASANPHINDIAEDHLSQHLTDNVPHGRAQHGDNGSPAMTDGDHPAHPHFDNIKFADDDSAHPSNDPPGLPALLSDLSGDHGPAAAALAKTFGPPGLTMSNDLSGDHGPAAPALAKTFDVHPAIDGDQFIFGKSFDHAKPDVHEIDHATIAEIQDLLEIAHDSNAASPLEPHHAMAPQDVIKAHWPQPPGGDGPF
jgi:LuxR family quorum sensing-dependent transcriptional regulator